ncbi:MAG: MalY/PatB family protein [Spirochaetota bacterium]
MDNKQRPGFVVSESGPADSIKWHVSRKKHPEMDPFWVADMDFRAPQPVLDALEARVTEGVFGYSFVPDSLYADYSAWSQRRYGWTPPPHASWLPGVMCGVHTAVSVFSEPGDRIIIQPPVYFPFADTVHRLDRTLVENVLVHTEGRYSMNLDELEQQAADGAKVMILCSPHNPVGRVWTAQELSAVTDICARHGVVLVSDEIHADLIVSDASFVPAASVSRAGLKLITLVSATKSFNLPGLPGAFAISDTRELLDRFEAGLGGCGADIPNVLTLTATSAAWRFGEAWLDQVLAYLKGNEDVVRDRFANAPLTISPLEGTYLLWIDGSQLHSDDHAMQRKFRDEAHAWLIPGSKFGSAGAGFLRMNIATDRDRLDAACRRIVGLIGGGT